MLHQSAAAAQVHSRMRARRGIGRAVRWLPARAAKWPAAWILACWRGQRQNPALAACPAHLHPLLVRKVKGKGLQGPKLLDAAAGLLVGGALLGIHHA